MMVRGTLSACGLGAWRGRWESDEQRETMARPGRALGSAVWGNGRCEFGDRALIHIVDKV